MSELKTDRAVYTAEDFILWTENELLEITPKFQRRGVWQPKAKSFLIDTMLREMTVPPLYFRLTQNQRKTKTIREVVDGQQRVKAVLEFIDDGFRLSQSLHASWENKRFSDLSAGEQRRIKEYGFTVETFKGTSDSQVLEVFCRLNMNGVPLNNQELRNGRFFGRFKQASFALALQHLEFWRQNKMFTELRIARMLEVELASELLIAGLSGMQDKKKSIDEFYQEYDDYYQCEERDKRRFSETISTIAAAMNGDLRGSAFRRPPLFYTLYCVVFHRMFGLPQIQRTTPRKRLSANERECLRDAVAYFSDLIDASKDPTRSVPQKYAQFISACQQQTDNILPRKVRVDAIYAKTF
jgi:hypothetical protein